MEEIQLDEKVAIIISEWMGYFLLSEGMLDTDIYARDKWLNKGGKIIPDKVSLYVAGIGDKKYKQEKVDFWKNVYDIDMGSLIPIFYSEHLVETIKGKYIISNQCKILEIDVNTVSSRLRIFF